MRKFGTNSLIILLLSLITFCFRANSLDSTRKIELYTNKWYISELNVCFTRNAVDKYILSKSSKLYFDNINCERREITYQPIEDLKGASSFNREFYIENIDGIFLCPYDRAKRCSIVRRTSKFIVVNAYHEGKNYRIYAAVNTDVQIVSTDPGRNPQSLESLVPQVTGKTDKFGQELGEDDLNGDREQQNGK